MVTLRTYRFGARPPTFNAPIAMEQLWRAHRYRNDLVEIERKRREEVAKFDKATDIGKKQIERANESASAEGRAARATCGVYWGSYLLVEAAMSGARKGKEPPHFERWDATGRLGVEIQHGISVARAFSGADTRLRILSMPDPAGMTSGSRRSGKRHLVSIRIGSDEHKDPVWASWPVTMRRMDWGMGYSGSKGCAAASGKRRRVRKRTAARASTAAAANSARA